MTRLFVPQKLASGLALELSQQQVHYLLHVMRIKEGAPLFVFNGEDGEWLAEVTAISKRTCKTNILSQRRTQMNGNELTLLFPPLKPKAQTYLIEKATEVGVTHFQPILTERSSLKHFNEEKARANAIEAAEQCERLSVPTFNELQPLQQILKMWPIDKPLMIGDETHASPPLITSQPQATDAFMVGPEGGWSSQEFGLFKTYPFVTTVDLGHTILRAETAAVVGLATIQQIRTFK